MHEELRLLLHLAGDFYRPFACPSEYNLNKALEMANRNDLGYYFASKVLSSTGNSLLITQEIRAKAQKIKSAGSRYAPKFRSSYHALEDALGSDFLLIKTYKRYPSLHSDIDILVPNLKEARRRFEKCGYRVAQDEQYKITAEKDRSLPVSVHSRIAWGGITVLDESFLWSNPKFAMMHGTRVRTPAPVGDLTIMLAHIPFERLKITLGDFLAICSFATDSDLYQVIREANSHGWSRTLKSIACIFDRLHWAVYGCASPFGEALKLNRGGNIITPQFPYMLPLRKVVVAHLEKRAWSKIPQFHWYVLTRWGSG